MSPRSCAPRIPAPERVGVKVLLFAGAADIVGLRTLTLETLDELSVRDAFFRLCSIYPRLNQLEGRVLFAANAEYASLEHVLKPGDELALIPPVSGGAPS